MTPSIRNPRLIVWLLTGLNLLNYLDRYVVSAVVAPLQAELHLSNFVGGLLSSVFLAGYIVASPIFGILGDRATTPGQRNLLLAVGIALWSAATVASGLVHSAEALIVSRALVGVGEASYTAIAPTLIDDVAPPSRRSRWMAFFYAATPIGSALGYIVGGAVLHASGWRAAFFVAGGPGLVLALLCLLISEARTRAPNVARVVARPAGASLARIGLYRDAVIGYCAHTFAIGGLAFWAPTYLAQRYGIAPARASVTFGMLTVVGGAVGTILGGWIADRAVNRAAASQENQPIRRTPRDVDDATARANLRVAAAACTLGAPLAFAALESPTLGGFLGLAFACQAALFLMSGPINVVFLRACPPELRATAMAGSTFAIHAFGDLWSPPLIGRLADGAPMQTALFVVPAGFAMAAIVWWRTASASERLT